MLRPTHQALAISTSVGLSLALSAPGAAAVTIVVTARATAMLPDKMEKIFGVPMSKHRTWTHYLITCIITGIILGLIVYGLLYGAAELFDSRADGRDARQIVRSLHQAAYGFGFLVWIGSTIGCVVHSLADACTLSGVPLLGPFNKKKIHLMPEGLRTRTGEIQTSMFGNKPQPFQMTAGEKRWFVGAYFATMGMLFLHFLPYIQGLQS